VTAATLVAATAMLVGAAIQSGLGFGFAIVAAPVIAATDGPAAAAPTLALASLFTSGLLLGAERREREVLRPAAARLIGWSLPGMVVGVVVLAQVPERPLGVLVAVAVLGAVALQLAGPRRSAAAPAGSGALAGLTSGVLQTSVGLNGPPLVLHLLRRGATPGQFRDTMATVFVTLSAISLVVFAVSGTFRVADAPGLLVGAAVAGWALGRLAHDRLRRVHGPLSLAVLAFGAVVALGQALL
jgi:uncharacterized protein